MGVRRTYACDLCQSGTDVNTAGWADQSWIKGQLHETTTTKGYCKLPEHAGSAWNYLKDSLLGSIRSLKCHFSTASDECWLSAWKHTVALLDPIALIHFCCIYRTLFYVFVLLFHNKENREIKKVLVLKKKKSYNVITVFCVWRKDFLLLHNLKTTKAVPCWSKLKAANYLNVKKRTFKFSNQPRNNFFTGANSQCEMWRKISREIPQNSKTGATLSANLLTQQQRPSFANFKIQFVLHI